MTATGSKWLCPDLVFDGQTLLADHALDMASGRIRSLTMLKNLPAGAECRTVPGTITPGYLDLQVNGGGDVFLNDTPTPSGMAEIAAAHRRFGTVGIMPTLITDAPEVLDRAAEAILAARNDAGILGLHIEGPHISEARRGTHATRFIRPLDDRTIAVVTKLRRAGVAVMITVAPEATSPGQIAALAATGAVVSIGHSDASAAEVRAALEQGASCFTHLFNAMSPMLNRAPGVTGACINSTAYAGIICDGVHVADEMLGLALRARPVPDTTFLVSDAMPTVGGSDRFSLYGDEISLEHGRLVNSEGSLAGAHVTMAQSVARLIRHVGVTPETALRMAVTIPARVISAPHLSGVIGREVSDLLVLDSNWQVCGTCATLDNAEISNDRLC